MRNSLARNSFVQAKSLGEMPIEAHKRKNVVVNRCNRVSSGWIRVVHLSALKNTKAFVIEMLAQSETAIDRRALSSDAPLELSIRLVELLY